MKVRLQDALDKAHEIDKTLMCTEFKNGCLVNVQHEDGSVMFFTSAFVRQWGEFYLVFTEHQGTHAYHSDDAVVTEYHRQVSKRLTRTEVAKWHKDMELYKANPVKWWEQQKK